jgi:hypothetical protein
MNKRRIVRLSNLIGIIAIVLLVYWVFVFVSVEVFKFKVFRQNITETFYLSVFGILALMAGALIINIMMNLTIIADRVEDDHRVARKPSKLLVVAIACSFPLIFGFLYMGDQMTARQKKRVLLNAVEDMIVKNPAKMNELSRYSFTRGYIDSVSSFLRVVYEAEANFPGVSVIVRDSVENMKVFLHIRNYNNLEDTGAMDKKDFIYTTSVKEATYLNEVFEKGSKEIRFHFNGGSYELYYPLIRSNKTIVFYVGALQNYGKL